MNRKNKKLFEPIVDVSKLHLSFDEIRTSEQSEPARVIMNEVFQTFTDTDGNFVEQFQTTGFDARIFELYLHTYFSESGYGIFRKHEQPDFIVTRDEISVAIEATTANPTQTNITTESDVPIESLTQDQVREKLYQEIPIKLGSPLFSKLQKKYWELPHCKDLPIVLAIEAFHEKESLIFSDYSLGQYLYGLKHFPTWTKSGKLIVKSEKVESHKLGEKAIPSNFFEQPDTEHISAVLFTNSGTYPKFNRMGYQAGYHRGNIKMIRFGTCFNPDQNSAIPLKFYYDLDDPHFEESWGQGLVVFYNPNAIHPIPRDFFVGAAQHYMEDGVLKTDCPMFHPFASITSTLLIKNKAPKLADDSEKPIGTILKSEYEKLTPSIKPMMSDIAEEKEWFSDLNRNILGIILKDKIDDDYVYVVLGQDKKSLFYAIDINTNIESHEQARKKLLGSMEKFRQSGQKVFPREE